MDLREFLQPLKAEKESIALSSRYKDAQGKTLLWEIRMLTAKEDEKLRKQSLRKDADGSLSMDYEKYAGKLAAAATLTPNLKSSELQDAYGVLGEEDLLKKMLNPGEYARYLRAVQRLNGFDVSFEELTETAKN